MKMNILWGRYGMNRILLVDDDREQCALLKRAVAREGLEADCCFSGREALEQIARQDYQLVILDVLMPGADGFETMAKIRAKSGIPILMLTARNDHRSMVRGLRAGADDYMTKPFDMEELLARIVSLIRRYTCLNNAREPATYLRYKGLTIDLDARTITTVRGTFELPPKEFDILLYCARHQGKILTRAQIYEAVWGEPYVWDDGNIMAVISRLRKKLEPDPSHPTYLQTVKGMGYRFNKDV